MWHNESGHATSKVVKHVLRRCNISYINKMEFDLCKSCCLAKSHRLLASPFLTNYNTPLELVFANLGNLLNLFKQNLVVNSHLMHSQVTLEHMAFCIISLVLIHTIKMELLNVSSGISLNLVSHSLHKPLCHCIFGLTPLPLLCISLIGSLMQL